jgi:hypothetical protein
MVFLERWSCYSRLIIRLAPENFIGPLVDDIFKDRERRQCGGPTRVKRPLRHDFRRLRFGQPLVHRPVYLEGRSQAQIAKQYVD